LPGPRLTAVGRLFLWIGPAGDPSPGPLRPWEEARRPAKHGRYRGLV